MKMMAGFTSIRTVKPVFFSQRSQVLILYWGCMFPMHIRLVLGTDLLAAFLKNSLNDLDSGLRPFRPQVCVIVQC